MKLNNKKDTIMRNIITFTVIAISLFATSCSKKRTWLEESGMKGCIISFTDTVWYASDKFGEVHKEWIENYTKVDLNEDGQITAITKYDKDGDIQEKTVQEWKDKYTISSVTYYKEDGNPSSKETFKFNGDKVSSIQVDDYMDNSEEKLTYEYDKDRVTKIIGSKKGKKKIITFIYIGENDSYKQVFLDYDGSKSESTSYFDSDKKLVKWFVDGDKYTYQYDKNGLLERSTYSNFVNTYEYKFDEKGNWIERVEREKWAKEKTHIKSFVVRCIEYKKY